AGDRPREYLEGSPLSALSRLLRSTDRAILSNASSLVGTTVLTSALGFVFWWLAARTYSAEIVGLAAAATSAMSLLGNLAVLGLGTLLIAELGRQRHDSRSLILTALIIAQTAGSCLGLAFAVLAPLVSPDFQP